ncbi:hypothetical protein FKP32DRAFT_1679517 [Trametes sanguinea]|nr:hypothetical protein FKP32DRAFT_1679517 [Trametes sanguinea]
MSSLATPGQLLAPSIGAIMLGTFTSLVLYGISAHQFFQYMRQFPKDSLIIKSLAISVMILNTLHSIAPMHSCYYYLVTNYAQPVVLLSGVWSLNILTTLGALLVLTSECFFAARVFLMGSMQWKSVAGVAQMASNVSRARSLLLADLLVSTSVATTRAFQIDILLEYGERAKMITIMAFVLAAIADHMLAGAIILTLYRSRANHTRHDIHTRHLDADSSTGLYHDFSHEARPYLLMTGSASSILQAVTAILAITQPLKLYYGAFGLVNIKVYVITLFSVLNSRQLFVSRGIRVFNDEAFGRDIISRAHRLATVERWNVPQIPDEARPPVINVKVMAETEVHGHSDSDLSREYDSKGLPPAGHDS